MSTIIKPPTNLIHQQHSYIIHTLYFILRTTVRIIVFRSNDSDSPHLSPEPPPTSHLRRFSPPPPGSPKSRHFLRLLPETARRADELICSHRLLSALPIAPSRSCRRFRRSCLRRRRRCLPSPPPHRRRAWALPSCRPRAGVAAGSGPPSPTLLHAQPPSERASSSSPAIPPPPVPPRRPSILHGSTSPSSCHRSTAGRVSLRQVTGDPSPSAAFPPPSMSPRHPRPSCFHLIAESFGLD